ncbi:MAG: ABC transporter substrate-binding protein, partial [Enterobacteriaceae bacterium]
ALSERSEEYIAAQRILERELPVLPLVSSLQLQAYRSDIKGLVFSSFGNATFAKVYRQRDNSEAPQESKP